MVSSNARGRDYGKKVELVRSKDCKAPVVQLEERQPPKLDVASSNLAGRGINGEGLKLLPIFISSSFPGCNPCEGWL